MDHPEVDPEGGSRDRELGGRGKFREEKPGTEHGEGWGNQSGGKQVEESEGNLGEPKEGTRGVTRGDQWGINR